ncbi:MAG TPA: DNA polymerase III subunit beta, partial [Candidatus Dojkabacteria bacterium]|nr:DNA polymerase III subunit beta [Candidatus Dojkabacteria bacterium]
MRFEVSSSELLRQLTIASGAINNNPVLPIMEDFLFSIKDDVLTITSTNLETTIITRLNVTADSSGAIAIPAKILLETIKALPEQPITFTVDENNGIKILSTFGVYKISGELADDFPESPIEDNVETFVIPSKRVLKGITNTVFATSSD